MLQRPQQFKVVLLGEGRVGKTSLVLRFCKGTFAEGQPPTIQASCLDKVLRIGERSLHLVIWDTAGQERFHALGPIYYRDADAALLVFDITDSDSFGKVKTWVKELRKMVPPPLAESHPPLPCLYLSHDLLYFGRRTADGARPLSQWVGWDGCWHAAAPCTQTLDLMV